MSSQPPQELSLPRSLLASSFAGCVARVVCHPIDTIKARLQASSSSLIISPSSLSSLYKGLGAALVGGVPATCLYLTSYEAAKDFYSQAPFISNSTFVVPFLSGMTAEAFSCIVFVPTDVIKERLQVQEKGKAIPGAYAGSWDALKQILRQEGLRGLYKGYGASMISFGPFSAVYFSIYEMMKERQGMDKQGAANNLYSAAVSGAVASFLTNPLDLAKLRLQISRTTTSTSSTNTNNSSSGSNSSSGPSTTFSMLRHVYRSEGTRGLFRGAAARVLFHTPNTAITMACFEESKRLLSA